MRNTTSPKLSDAPISAQPSITTDLKRRRFLLTLGASGAGVAVAAASGVHASAAASEAVIDVTDNASAYRETAHVRDYYRTTRI
jgi:hypothetical protein